MKFFLTYFFLIFSISVCAQLQKTENFIFRHNQFEYNDRGILITPVDSGINKAITSYVQFNYPNVVESVRNVVWLSYETFTNPISKSHIEKYSVRVQIKNKNQNQEFRYLEVEHDMNTDKFSSKYDFNKGKRNFVLNEKEAERRSFLSNLEELGIKNAPEKTNIEKIIFDYKELVNGERKNQIPGFLITGPDNYEIYDKIVAYVKRDFNNVSFVMNIAWDSYSTFLSNYDIYNYHTYVVQVRLRESDSSQFIEVLYNPFKKEAISDFIWNKENGFFERKQN
jgi:disulfide oxidoreductase YuzD